MIQNFRTYELAKAFYKDCQNLKLKQPAKDQFDRAVLSIVLNFAEGVAKPTAKDRRKFYSTSMGSLREVQAILELPGNAIELKKSDQLAGCLFRLIQNPGGT